MRYVANQNLKNIIADASSSMCFVLEFAY